MKQIFLKSGESLFKEGEKSDFVYLVKSGLIEVLKSVKDSPSLSLAKVQPGEYVGELGVLQGSLRSATARTLEDSALESFSRKEFISHIVQHKDKSMHLIQNLACRSHALFSLSEKILEQLTDVKHQSVVWDFFNSLCRKSKSALLRSKEKKEFAQNLSNTEASKKFYTKGEVIFHQGAGSNWAGLVLDGKLLAKRSLGAKSIDLGYIEKGHFLGEMGLISGSLRHATVVAEQDSSVRGFSEPEFMEMIDSDPQLALRLVDDLGGRLLSLNLFLMEIIQDQPGLDNSLKKQLKLAFDSANEVLHLTGNVALLDLKRLKTSLDFEVDSTKEMFETYKRFLVNEASGKEMEKANEEFRNLLKTLGIGTIFLLPGGLITLPLVIKMGKVFGIDLYPRIFKSR